MSSIFLDALRRLSQAHLSEITLHQERCIDLCWKEKQLCTACQDNCVAGAIRIGAQVEIDWSRCIRCGVCAAACPTEVFELQMPSDQVILKEMVERNGQEQIQIVCDFVKGQFQGKERQPRTKGRTITVSCIGRFSETFLLESAILGGSHLEFAKCTSDCRFATGRKVVEEMRWRSNTIIANFEAAPQQDNSIKKTASDRRILLGEAGLQAMRMILPINMPNSTGENIQHKLATHRDNLINLMKSQTPLGGPISRGDMPFGSITLDAEKCQLHGDCSKACPTGALRLLDNNQGKELKFLYGACVGCRACLDACPAGAPKLEDNFDLARLAAPWVTLMSRQYRLCTSCGRQFSVKMGSDSQVCSACESRWAQIEKYANESSDSSS